MVNGPVTHYAELRELEHDFKAPEGIGIRTTRKDLGDISELEASIRAVGLIVPLVVKEHHKTLYVITGNRRLEALRRIYGDTVRGEETPVLVINADRLQGSPAEIALADNVIRLPLHAVDQMEAFGALIAGGAAPDDIATRFGIKQRQVEQALALSKIAAPIRQAWRDGKITAKVAQLFTLEPNQARQMKAFRALVRDDGSIVSAYTVRRELIGDSQNGSEYVNFIGVEAYIAAGGKVTVDLFNSEHVISDQVLAKRLADEKLADHCQSLIAEGWKWAALESDLPSNWSYSWKQPDKESERTVEEAQQLVDLGAELIRCSALENGSDEDDALIARLRHDIRDIEQVVRARAFDEKARKKVGVVISLRDDGTLEHTFGVAMPLAAAAKVEQTATPEVKAADRKKTAKKRANPDNVSAALETRLTEQLALATKEALKVTSQWADDKLFAVLAGVISNCIKPERPYDQPQPLTSAMDQIRGYIEAEIFNPAIEKHFDAKGYFNAIPMAAVLTVILEIDPKFVAPTKLSKAALVAEALNLARESLWLPKQLRTVHYAGQKARQAAKSKGKSKRR